MYIYKYEILNVKICQTNLHNMVLCFIKINEIKINPCYLQVDRDIIKWTHTITYTQKIKFQSKRSNIVASYNEVVRGQRKNLLMSQGVVRSELEIKKKQDEKEVLEVFESCFSDKLEPIQKVNGRNRSDYIYLTKSLIIIRTSTLYITSIYIYIYLFIYLFIYAYCIHIYLNI